MSGGQVRGPVHEQQSRGISRRGQLFDGGDLCNFLLSHRLIDILLQGATVARRLREWTRRSHTLWADFWPDAQFFKMCCYAAVLC